MSTVPETARIAVLTGERKIEVRAASGPTDHGGRGLSMSGVKVVMRARVE